MKRIDDERIKFYLKHRQQIEEWLDVKNDLAKFAHEFYASLRDDIRMKVPDDVIVGDVSEPPGNSGLFRLGRCDWPEEGPAVELGWWHKGKMDFSHNPNKQAVWCGLYADQNSPYWQQLFDARGPSRNGRLPRMEPT